MLYYRKIEREFKEHRFSRSMRRKSREEKNSIGACCQGKHHAIKYYRVCRMIFYFLKRTVKFESLFWIFLRVGIENACS